MYDLLTSFISHLENIDLLCTPTLPNVELNTGQSEQTSELCPESFGQLSARNFFVL